MLDDVFGDLDPRKTEILLDALQKHEGQTFITSANPVPFEEYVTFDGDRNKLFSVQDGQVREEK